MPGGSASALFTPASAKSMLCASKSSAVPAIALTTSTRSSVAGALFMARAIDASGVRTPVEVSHTTSVTASKGPRVRSVSSSWGGLTACPQGTSSTVTSLPRSLAMSAQRLENDPLVNARTRWPTPSSAPSIIAVALWLPTATVALEEVLRPKARRSGGSMRSISSVMAFERWPIIGWDCSARTSGGTWVGPGIQIFIAGGGAARGQRSAADPEGSRSRVRRASALTGFVGRRARAPRTAAQEVALDDEPGESRHGQREDEGPERESRAARLQLAAGHHRLSHREPVEVEPVGEVHAPPERTQPARQV